MVTSSPIIDKRIQDPRLALLRPYRKVGYRRWDQRAVPLLQQDLIPCAPHMDHTIPLDTHRDDKTVILPKVTMERF